ncbi:MAG: hypothetical protein R3C97_09265 [Geminicoccaceae bacterium]
MRGLFKKPGDYHKSGRAHFDEIELLSIIDVTARTNALTTGEIDVARPVRPQDHVHLLARNPAIQGAGNHRHPPLHLPMRADMAPHDDANSRRALKWGLDRPRSWRRPCCAAMAWSATIIPSHPRCAITRAISNRQPTIPTRRGFYLKEAGLSNLTVDLSAADAAFAGAVDAATLYREHAAAAGIEINIVREPNDGYWSNVWLKKPWCACYWGGRPTEDWMFSTAYQSGVAWNDTYWSDERFDAPSAPEARSQLNDGLRGEMYREMRSILRDDGGLVCAMFASYVFALRQDRPTNKWAAAGTSTARNASNAGGCVS